MLQEPMNRESFSPKTPLSPYPRPLPKTPLQTLRDGKNKASSPNKASNNSVGAENSIEGPTTSPSKLTGSNGIENSPKATLLCDSPGQYFRQGQNSLLETNEETRVGSTPISSPKKESFGILEVKSPSQSKLFSRLSPKPPLSAEPLSPSLTSDEGSPITSPNTSPGSLNPQGRIAIKPLGLNGGRRLSKPLPTPRSFSSNIDPKVAELKRQQIQITDLQHQLEVEKEINEDHQDRLLRVEQTNQALQDEMHQMRRQNEEYLERIHEISKRMEAAERLVKSLKQENSQLQERYKQEKEIDGKNLRDQIKYAHLELIRAASMADEGIRMLLNGVQGANNVAQLLSSIGKIQVSSDEKPSMPNN